MNTTTTVLLCVIVALACSLAWLGILLRREKVMRRDAESGEEFWINVSKEQHGLLKEAVKETQSMICQGVETISKQIEGLSAGGMDAEARLTLEADLGRLLSYSMDDAFKAAKGIGSDAE